MKGNSDAIGEENEVNKQVSDRIVKGLSNNHTQHLFLDVSPQFFIRSFTVSLLDHPNQRDNYADRNVSLNYILKYSNRKKKNQLKSNGLSGKKSVAEVETIWMIKGLHAGTAQNDM